MIVVGKVVGLRRGGRRRTEGWVDGRRPEEEGSHRGSREGKRARNSASNDRIGREKARKRKMREVMSLKVKLIESSGGTADPARQENKHEKKFEGGLFNLL